MIDAYSQEIENYICSFPIVVTHEFHLAHLSPFTAYIEGTAIFTDGSKLFFFEFLRLEKHQVKREKYRYQYASENDRLFFRYDNAPHYRKLKTFPDHKHLSNKVIESEGRQLKEVLHEIEEIVLGLPSV